MIAIRGIASTSILSLSKDAGLSKSPTSTGPECFKSYGCVGYCPVQRLCLNTYGLHKPEVLGKPEVYP